MKLKILDIPGNFALSTSVPFTSEEEIVSCRHPRPLLADAGVSEACSARAGIAATNLAPAMGKKY